MEYTVYSETSAEDDEFFYKYFPLDREVVHYPKHRLLKRLTLNVEPEAFKDGSFRIEKG